jgi:hypothetical protein
MHGAAATATAGMHGATATSATTATGMHGAAATTAAHMTAAHCAGRRCQADAENQGGSDSDRGCPEHGNSPRRDCRCSNVRRSCKSRRPVAPTTTYMSGEFAEVSALLALA